MHQHISYISFFTQQYPFRTELDCRMLCLPMPGPKLKELHPVAILLYYNMITVGGKNTTVNLFKRKEK